MRYRYTYRDCQEVKRRRRTQRLAVIAAVVWTIFIAGAILFMVLP